MLLDIGYTIGFRLVKDFGSFFFHGNENDEESEVRDGFHFFCFFNQFPQIDDSVGYCHGNSRQRRVPEFLAPAAVCLFIKPDVSSV